MHQHGGAGDRINSYALVSYVPGRLGAFLDRVRRELVSTCVAQSHITILPPRAVFAPERVVTRQLQTDLDAFSKFSVHLTDVQVFTSTSVVYLGVGLGCDRLIEMHAALNHGSLEFEEQFAFHPHVTLAQGLSPEVVGQVADRAAQRWAEFDGPRHFDVDRLTFVQNTVHDCWVDLETFTLADLELAALERAS
ncbi:MAG TPA: 2'-5' RNA ligase family protein [Bryobacteraceae bacterium]|nr:2'-5' RNA ligase family protein [Bryobacteraceae bacterium]